MTRRIILSLFVISVFVCASSDAHARGSMSFHSSSGSHGHSHGRTPVFRSFLPGYKSHSRLPESTTTYTKSIYRYKEQPLPRVYTLEKPLINDAGIFRPFNIRREYSQLDFYRFDPKKDQYAVPNVLHADARAASAHRSITIEMNGQIFYYNDGFFYKESGEHFIVVPPVINSIVPTIPQGSTNVGSHYEYNGIYFRRINQDYQVVRAII